MSVTDYDQYGDSASQIVTHAYDAGNRWIRRDVTDDSGNTTRTVFAHDRGQVAFELEDTVATPSEDLTRADLTKRYLWGPAVDQLLAEEQIDDPTTSVGNETLWTLADHLGSVRDVVDNTGGVRLHREYDSFGNIENETFSGAAIDTIDFAYTGKYRDDATGLQNNWMRWYDATVGRWISEDPIGFAGGDANLARYVGNGATTLVDPSGLFFPIPDPWAARERARQAGEDGRPVPPISVYMHGMGMMSLMPEGTDDVIDAQSDQLGYAVGDAVGTVGSKLGLDVDRTLGSLPIPIPSGLTPNGALLTCDPKPVEIRNVDVKIRDLQTVLDVAGALPIIGIPADIVNSVIYAYNGDSFNAGVSLAAMMPLVGDAAQFGRIGRRLEGLLRPIPITVSPIHRSSLLSAIRQSDALRYSGQNATPFQLADDIDGVTAMSSAIARAIRARRIRVNILSDDVFAKAYQMRNNGSLEGLDDTCGFAYGNQIYLRRGSDSLLVDTVHEGTHGLDWLNDFRGPDRAWKLRAYSYESEFAQRLGLPYQLTGLRQRLLHIWYAYPD